MSKIDIDDPAAVAARTEKRLKAVDDHMCMGAPLTVDTVAGLYIRDKIQGVDDPKKIREVCEQVDLASGRGGQVKLPGSDVNKVPENVGGEQRRQELANLQVAPAFSTDQFGRAVLQHLMTTINGAGKVIGQIARDMAQV